MRRAVLVAGVVVDLANLDLVVDEIEGFVTEGRATGRTHQVATINTQFVVSSWTDHEVRQILHQVDLATCDGTPVLWATRLLGAGEGARVTGVDLVPKLASRAEEKGLKVFLFGARPGVADRAGQVLLGRYPGLNICGVLSPDDVKLDTIDPDIVATIRAGRS